MNKCKNCGNCCTDVLFLTPSEISTIKKYIKENKITTAKTQNIFNEDNEECPFLNSERKCNIYEVRPFICKRFTCYDNSEEDLDYKNIQVVDMCDTFFPKDYHKKRNLTFFKNYLNDIKEKIYRKEKQNERFK